MDTYVILRRDGWKSGADLEAAASKSAQIGDEQMSDDIRWIRSYVIQEEGGTLGTVCIYQATSVDAVKQHAERVEMPADEVLEVADTVVIRPDPQPEQVTA